jgi:hypothetical protein
VRAYSASSEETLLARNLLKEWAGDGFLTEVQYQRMEQDTVCELRRTNIFLRIVLFLFTLIIVGAATGLFFEVFLPHPPAQTVGIFLLIFAAASYAGAELAVSQARLYRYGIEEALAACSVCFFCVGLQLALFGDRSSSPASYVLAAGAIVSLWIWHRFGLAYAFLAAMIFVFWLPDSWTSSHSAQHVIVGALYAAGLITVALARSRNRLLYLDEGYSIVEALLWLGIYLEINLQLSSINLLGQWWGRPRTTSEFSGTFYWTTFVLIWCMPPAVLSRGLRRQDRYVIAVGVIAAVLTLATNKPYLGWERHTWDPMLLGALLVGIAVLVHRWLAGGPGGIRYGFTAQRLSAKERRWMNAGAVTFGLAAPGAVPHSTASSSADVHFGGGDSGGGGASSDF